MDALTISQYISVSGTLLFITVAASFDFKTREVPDKVWIAYGPIGLALTIFRTYLNPSQLIPTVASIGLSILIAFGLVFFGLAGGADAKALMCLGFALPLPPGIVNPLLGYFQPFFPIVVLVTAYICSLSVAIWMLARNLVNLTLDPSAMFKGLESEPGWKKALALATGYRTTVARLASTFYLYPMEKIVEDEKGAHRTLQLYANADVDREEVVDNFRESLQKVGSPQTVWVTPGLPLLLFILFAVVISLFLGDPIFAVLSFILRH